MNPEEIRKSFYDLVSTTQLFTDIEAAKKKFFYIHPHTSQLESFTQMSIDSSHHELKQNMKKALPIRFEKIVYEQHYGLIEKDYNYVFNSYYSPRNYYEEKQQATLPSIYLHFFKHLFPEQLSYEFMMDYMSASLKKKLITYVFLQGNQGIGKGIYVDILKQLHLLENTTIIDDDSFSRNFNGSLEGKSLCIADEIKIKTDSAMNKLKTFINGDMKIEAKHKDEGLKKVYFNLIIISNLEDAISICEGDRRFSIPEVTENNLMNTKLPKCFKDWEEYIKELTKKENIEQLFNYLWERNVTRNFAIPFISAKTKQLIESSKLEWELIAYEYVTKKKKVASKEVLKHIIEYSSVSNLSERKLLKMFKEKFSSSIDVVEVSRPDCRFELRYKGGQNVISDIIN